jgi:SAM-dependent methyltransferase
VLTVDFDRLDVQPGCRLLDLGCGQGRHAFEARRRGARVVALDREGADCKDSAGMLAAMAAEERLPEAGAGWAVNGDGLALPFADDAFDRVIAAEVLEHVDDDAAAIAELVRVLRPGGRLAVTVPRWFPERVCWALADDYHAPAVPGGHVRVYRRAQLLGRLRSAGLQPVATHHAHALHAPYWWLKCAVGVGNDGSPLVRAYHRFLVADIVRPRPVVRALEGALNPLVGKSLVVYAERPC